MATGNIKVDSVRAQKYVISGLGATATLGQKNSGALVLLDKADGITITLPASAKVGTYFDFMVTVTSTSVGYKIITGLATELLVGAILSCDTDSSDAVAIWKSLVATANISITLGGADTTKGGVKGDRVRFVKLNATTWNVEGTTLGTGTVATPFATS